MYAIIKKIFLMSCLASSMMTLHAQNVDGRSDYGIGDNNRDLEFSGYDVEGAMVLSGWFGEAPVGEVYTTLTKTNGKYHFNGPTGVYTFQLIERNGKKYLKVIPLATRGAGDYANAWDSHGGENYLWYNSDNGSGAIYISGGSSFGFPYVNADFSYQGWNVNSQENPYGDNTTALYKDANSNVYSISITTGRQIQSNQKFSFKFYHSPLYEIDLGGWQKWHEFRHRSKNDNPNGTTIEFKDPTNVDFLHVTDGNNSENPSYGEGNITTSNVGPYSSLPDVLPDGYTFKFVIDLATLSGNDPLYNNTPWSYNHAPLTMEITRRVYPQLDATTTGNYTVYLNNSTDLSGSKRIKLRDALRFDCNLLYAHSYDAVNYQNVPVMNELVITGALDSDDMEYLTWLARHDRIGKLDLSQATLPGNRIPDDFANSKHSTGTGNNNQNLTEVILPQALQTLEQNSFWNCVNLSTVTFIGNAPNLVTVGPQAFRNCPSIKTINMSAATGLATIGGSAFCECTQLANINISGAQKGQVRIGDNAFHSCVALSSEQINALILRTKDIIDEGAYWNCTSTSFTSLTITDNILEIRQSAFADDSQLTDVYVPARVAGASVEESTVNPDEVGNTYVNYTIPTTIYARDFNGGRDTGWHWTTEGKTPGYDNGLNDYRTDDAKRAVFLENGTADAPGNIGWIKDGDWFNYTFYCPESGLYKLTAVAKFISGTILQVSFDGTTTSNFFNNGTGVESDYVRYVYITQGYHAMKVEPKGDINVFRFIFEKDADYHGYKNSVVPGKVEAENFNPGTAYHQDQNNVNTYYERGNEKTYISNNENPSNGFGLGYSTIGDSYDYTFTANADGVYEIDFYTRGVNAGTLDITIDGKPYSTNIASTGNWNAWVKTGTLEGVQLPQGQHTMSVKYGFGLDMDYMDFKKTGDLIITTSVIPDSKFTNSWSGINSNDCEVHFDGPDETNNYRAYRDDEQVGWMYLLTKTLNQSENYSNVNQHHADVLITRTFRVVSTTERQKNWYSVVFPFQVDAATLLSAKTNEGKYLFDRAAKLDNTAFNHSTYPSVHFSYLNNSPFLAKWKAKDGKAVREVEAYNPTTGTDASLEYDDVDFLDADGSVLAVGDALVPAGNEMIPAGTPFIVRTYNVNSDSNNKQYRFTDVRTYPSTDKPHGTDESGDYAWHGNLTNKISDKFSFVGNVYTSQRDFKTGEWYLSGGWYAGKDGDPDYWVSNYRAIFTAPASAAPQLYRFLFGGGDATGIRLADEDAVSAGADCIYNLSGQLVRKGTSTEGLSKGIYIINGKRVAVK